MKNATRAFVSTFGGLVGLIGIEHGLGEVLQGNTAPGGLMILSWPNSAFFRILGGEPALTILPNLLLTGILAIIFSLAYLLWSVLFAGRRRGGLVLMLLCIPMLLFGAGVFPPVLGVLIGAAATRLRSPLAWWREHLSPGARRLLEMAWPWFFGACLLAWLAMFPGVPVLSYFFGVESEALLFTILAGMFGFLSLSAVAGFAVDAKLQQAQ